MSFKDHWEDYNFRNKCGLEFPRFYRETTFSFEDVKRIAKHSYNAGFADAAKINPQNGTNPTP